MSVEIRIEVRRDVDVDIHVDEHVDEHLQAEDSACIDKHTLLPDLNRSIGSRRNGQFECQSQPPCNSSSSDDDDSVIVLYVKRLSDGVQVDKSKIKREARSSTRRKSKAKSLLQKLSNKEKSLARQLFLGTATEKTNSSRTTTTVARETRRATIVSKQIERALSPVVPRRQRSIKTSLARASPKLPLQAMRQDNQKQESEQLSDRIMPQGTSTYYMSDSRARSQELKEVVDLNRDHDYKEPLLDQCNVVPQCSGKELRSVDIPGYELNAIASKLASLCGDSSHNAFDCDGENENFSLSSMQYCEDFDRTPKKLKRQKTMMTRRHGKRKADEDEDFELSQEIIIVDSNIRKTKRRAKPTTRYEPIERLAGSIRSSLIDAGRKSVYKDTSSEDESDDMSEMDDGSAFERIVESDGDESSDSAESEPSTYTAESARENKPVHDPSSNEGEMDERYEDDNDGAVRHFHEENSSSDSADFEPRAPVNTVGKRRQNKTIYEEASTEEEVEASEDDDSAIDSGNQCVQRSSKASFNSAGRRTLVSAHRESRRQGKTIYKDTSSDEESKVSEDDDDSDFNDGGKGFSDHDADADSAATKCESSPPFRAVSLLQPEFEDESDDEDDEPESVQTILNSDDGSSSEEEFRIQPGLVIVSRGRDFSESSDDSVSVAGYQDII